MAKIEKAHQPTGSPFVLWFGSFDAWVETHVLPCIENGALDREFIVIVGALRSWETNGMWEEAYATC